jgi:hypothetical protein
VDRRSSALHNRATDRLANTRSLNPVMNPPVVARQRQPICQPQKTRNFLQSQWFAGFGMSDCFWFTIAYREKAIRRQHGRRLEPRVSISSCWQSRTGGLTRRHIRCRNLFHDSKLPTFRDRPALPAGLTFRPYISYRQERGQILHELPRAIIIVVSEQHVDPKYTVNSDPAMSWWSTAGP